MSKIDYEYDDMIKDFGQPMEIIEDKDTYRYYYCVYDGLTFTYPMQGRSMLWVTINSPQYRFGSKNIGIDSRYEDVRSAYKHAKYLQVNPNYIKCKDDDFPLTFYFDQNRIVEKIVVGRRY